jgi:hypothetical protein
MAVRTAPWAIPWMSWRMVVRPIWDRRAIWLSSK